MRIEEKPKSKVRLRCDNIDDFINGVRRYYSVSTSDEFNEGDIVTLYSHDTECDFIIQVAFCVGGFKRLGVAKHAWRK